MDTKYQVTVTVLTYHPNKEKLFATLKSILLQENVRFQIVVADDGSEKPLFEETEAFFKENGFADYVLVKNPVNRGTVYNILSAVQNSAGTFIKAISPGDMLADETVLARWVAALEQSGADLSFSEAVYYRLENGNPKAVIETAHPQNIKCYNRGDSETARYRYLILHDLFLGAATLCRRDVFLKYLQQIAGNVVYAEDQAYRLMAYDRVPVHYFPENAVVYETGLGISTSGSAVWKERLQRDDDAGSRILLSRPVDREDKTAQLFRYLLQQQRQDPVSKLVKFLRVPGLLTQKFKPARLNRKTTDVLPGAFLDKIF